jgi:integrase
MTFGSYPAITLAQARSRAMEVKAAVETGQPIGADTLQAICEEYQRREGHRLRTAKDRQQILERHVYPAMGSRPIADIKRSEIVRLLDRIEDRSGQRMADVTLALVGRIMNWHAARSDEFRSPIVRGMARGTAKPRERILTDDELRAIWTVPVIGAEREAVFARLVRFLLLTATRRNEVAHARHDEIKGGDWLIPAARFKTGIDHLVLLSRAALDLINGAGEFIFTTGARPLGSMGKRKEEFDRACGVTDWRLHDLRRTARSLMSRAGVNADIAERCLGLALGLDYFSLFVSGRKVPARADEIRDDERMLKAANDLDDNLKVYLHLAEPPFELFDDDEIEHVEHVLDHLWGVIDFLKERIAEVPTRGGGPTPDGRMFLCAAVVGEAYQFVHNRDRVQPFSPAVEQACEVYWNTCGNKPTGRKHQGEPRNWAEHLKRYRASGGDDFIRSRFERYRTATHS